MNCRDRLAQGGREVGLTLCPATCVKGRQAIGGRGRQRAQDPERQRGGGGEGEVGAEEEWMEGQRWGEREGEREGEE